MITPSDRPARPLETLCLLGLAFLAFVGVSLVLLLQVSVQGALAHNWPGVAMSIVIGVIAVAMLIRRPS